MKQSTNYLKIVTHRLDNNDLHSWFKRCYEQSCQPDHHRRGTVFGSMELSCLINPGTVLPPAKIFSFHFSSFPWPFSVVVFSLNSVFYCLFSHLGSYERMKINDGCNGSMIMRWKWRTVCKIAAVTLAERFFFFPWREMNGWWGKIAN